MRSDRIFIGKLQKIQKTKKKIEKNSGKVFFDFVSCYFTIKIGFQFV